MGGGTHAYSSNITKIVVTHSEHTKMFWNLKTVSRNCDCCQKIARVGLLYWELNRNLKLFDVSCQKFTFKESATLLIYT